MPKVRTIDTTPFKFNLEKVNPLFSKSKIYVMYHGENRNASTISKEAVEKSLHTIKNIPIVGEFIERDGEGNFGGHGGKIEITDKDIKFVQTTKAIGVIPESAKVYWEVVKDKKDREREYLVVDGAYLWNRYEEEVRTLKEDNFGQSMELEVFDGEYDYEKDLYDIKEFAFSALCVLGIDKNGTGHVEPAFEDAKIITYSLDKESFKKEFSQMLQELKFSLSKEEEEKEVGDTMLKKLLEKYSLKVEDLTEKGIDFNEISEDELEAKIIEVFEIDVDNSQEDNQEDNSNDEDGQTVDSENQENGDENVDEGQNDNDDDNQQEDNDNANDDESKENDEENADTDFEVKVAQLENDLSVANETIKNLEETVKSLEEFKLKVEEENHEASVQGLFAKFQMTEEDVKDIDIHKFSLEELEEKCYAILGRKLASKKDFSLNSKENTGIRIPLDNGSKDVEDEPYGGLFSKYKNK